uniref:Uncharacterized protein n=1 Tax=Romanomermis culicivorax TaxID=13658 RepID=A0A915IGB7_ROMCU
MTMHVLMEEDANYYQEYQDYQSWLSTYVEEANKAGIFAVIADEATDCCGTEIMSVSIRYIYEEIPFYFLNSPKRKEYLRKIIETHPSYAHDKLIKLCLTSYGQNRWHV